MELRSAVIGQLQNKICLRRDALPMLPWGTFVAILGNDFKDHRLGRLPVDTIMAKLIWLREACDFHHRFTPLDNEDIFTRKTKMKTVRVWVKQRNMTTVSFITGTMSEDFRGYTDCYRLFILGGYELC